MVKLASPKDGGPKVAVKIVNKRDADFDKASLQQEIAIMKKVDHPNCIKLHEVFNEKSKMYLVLDLVTGGELFDRIIARGHYSEKDAAQLMHDVIGAVGCVHMSTCRYTVVLFGVWVSWMEGQKISQKQPRARPPRRNSFYPPFPLSIRKRRF